MFYFIIFILILIIFFIFNKYSFYVGKKLSLIDKEKKVPLLGGVFLFLGICLNTLYLFYFKILSTPNLIIFYFLLSMFFLAIIDDRFDISPILRLVLCSVLIILFFVESEFLIKTLNFKYLNLYFFPENIFITFFFSIFCMIVLIHAYNFIDGINGLATLAGISWLVYLSTKVPNLFETYLVFFIFILLFLYLNLKNKIFLGDSGNYIISSLVGITLIEENLSNPKLFYVEEILLLFLIPGLDFIRLFFLRIKNKKNPLNGDLNHFHHLLVNKLSLNKTLGVYCALIAVPLILFKINEDLLIFLLIVIILIYSLLIKKFSLKKN